MATLKHINSKKTPTTEPPNSICCFEHDEFTMKPVLDETGRLMMKEYHIECQKRKSRKSKQTELGNSFVFSPSGSLLTFLPQILMCHKRNT